MTSHAFSMAAKLATLDVGDVFFLPDDPPTATPTPMERQVRDRVVRSRLLEGRSFSTSRSDTITADHKLVHTLRVERTA